MNFSLVNPFALPSLGPNYHWTTSNGSSVTGQACANALTRCPLYEGDSHFAPNRWLLDKSPFSWRRDLGFENDVIAPDPVPTEGRLTDKGIPLYMTFADRTTLAGWKLDNRYLWAPFPVLKQGTFPYDPIMDIEKITAFVNQMPPLSLDQSTLEPGQTLRHYIRSGKPLPPQQKAALTSCLAFFRYHLLKNYSQQYAPLVTLTLRGRQINVDQTWSDVVLDLNGADDITQMKLEKYIPSLKTWLLENLDMFNLTSIDLCYGQRALFISGGQELCKADNQSPLPSAHVQMHYSKALQAIGIPFRVD